MADEIITTSYQNVNMSWANPSDALNALNNSSGGYTFIMITFLVTFILFITLAATFGFEVGLLTAAFVGLLLSLLFVYAGLMTWWVTSIFVGIIIITIIYIMWKQN